MTRPSPQGLIEAFGGRAARSLGQHFLVDPRALRQIVALSGAAPGRVVLEIGPGPGALTSELLASGAHVVAIEKDRRAVSFLQGRYLELVEGAADRLTVIEADAQRLAPLEALASHVGGPHLAVGNLPYNVGTAILLHLLASRGLFERLTFMFQKEVASRLAAQPKSRAYGSLSLAIQSHVAVRHGFDLGPASFAPPPKVNSAVLTFEPLSELPVPEALEALFERVTKASFSQRRKTLRNSLAGGLSISKERSEALLKAAGIDPRARAEEIGLEGYVALARVVGSGPR